MIAPGYEIPIHRSLTEPILMAGVPHQIAILNGTFVSAMLFGAHSVYSLPFGIIFHLLAAAATKKDPKFFDAFRRHIDQHNIYYA